MNVISVSVSPSSAEVSDSKPVFRLFAFGLVSGVTEMVLSISVWGFVVSSLLDSGYAFD